MSTLEPTPGQDADLRATVLGLADADNKLSEDAKLLILDALEPGGGNTQPSDPADGTLAAEPAHAYLKSISVKGFRGVGPEVRVPLRPGPGLVVISGRNGSGKSTIAEALELALTGNSYRWRNRTAVWSQNWRNLHSGGDTSIRLELAEENGGPITVGVDWAPGAELGSHSTWAQRQGAKREPGADPLGWAGPLELYRPLLSYDELGGVLDGQPKDLYDKLNVLLGLDRITEAQQRLNERLKNLQGPQQDLKVQTTQVKALLAGSDDERAQLAAKLLAKHKKDIAAVEALAVGIQVPRSEPFERLRRLSKLTVPSRQQVAEATERLRAAAADMTGRTGTLVEQSAQHADLLDQALALHDAHGDRRCPVCGVGVLDATWVQRTREALQQERSARAELVASRNALAAARREARTLIAGVEAPAGVDGFDLPELPGAVTAFRIVDGRIR